MYCIMCGAKQEPGGNFCAVCGAPMAKDVVIRSQAPAPPPPEITADAASARIEPPPPHVRSDEREKPLPEADSGKPEEPFGQAHPGTEEATTSLPLEMIPGAEKFSAPEPLSELDEQPLTEAPVTSRFKGLWILASLLILLLAAILSWGLYEKFKTKKNPTPPPLPPVVEMAPSIPVPTGPDEKTRITMGKLAALLEGIHQYADKNRGTLPLTLLEMNRWLAKNEALKDGWGSDLRYLVDTTHQSFVLRSNGPDKLKDTVDDIVVTNEEAESWLTLNQQYVQEWKLANPSLFAQLRAVGPSTEELKKLEDARKAEEEKKRQEAHSRAEAQRLEEEKRHQEKMRQEEEKQRQAEQARQEEEQRQARVREEAARRRQEFLQSMNISEDFSQGLSRWEAPEGWRIINEKKIPLLVVQGLGLLKIGQEWENYQAEFEIRIDKEAAGWIVRARDSRNLYLFKLASEKSKLVPKNSLIRYILVDGKYYNPQQQNDAPGAAAIVALPMKIRLKEFYRVRVVARHHQISHLINDTPVDQFEDETLTKGRFGFNASVVEAAVIRKLTIKPLE
jgi:hypothetical protein